MVSPLPDHFEGEDVIITFEKKYDSTYDSTTRTTAIHNVEGKLLNWNRSGGAQQTEDVFTFGGRTFNFAKPREKFTLEFEVVLNGTNLSLVHFGSSDSSATVNAMAGKAVKSNDSPSEWRVIFWFQEAAYHISRTVSATGGNQAYKVIVPSKRQPLLRWVFCDCKAVTFDKEMSADEYAKGTLTLEFSATDSNANANAFEQEGYYSATTSEPALDSMATTASGGILVEAKGYLDYVTTTANWYAGSTTTNVAKRYRYTG